MIGRADIRWDETRHFACPEHAVVEGCDVLTLREGKIAAKRSYRKGRV